MLMFCRQHSYLVAVSKSAFSIIDNQLVFLLEQLQNRYLLHLACHPHILEHVAGSAYAEMMGVYPGPQILLLQRFQTHRQFVNKVLFEDSFTSQLTADAVADVKEVLGTFPMSALTEEQTYDDYHELINITYISWHYSSLRHTICGTCKVDVEDDIHIASHCALLCKHSNWSPIHGLLLLCVWSDGLE